MFIGRAAFVLCISKLTHRNEKKHHAGEREATRVAKVTWIFSNNDIYSYLWLQTVYIMQK